MRFSGPCRNRGRAGSGLTAESTPPSRNAVARAGLKDFRFHDLRHHFASWFMMRGGDLLSRSRKTSGIAPWP